MNKLSVVTIVFLGFLASPSFGQDIEHGKAGFQLCAGCHGLKGQGLQLVNAPRLAGLEDWYLERQINNFRAKIRGASPADVNGHQMAQMAAALTSDKQVADLVAYIGTLPQAKAASTVSGDIERGKAAYAPCTICHGAAAEGNKVMNAPALATLDDWYQVAQLKKFREGQRGADSKDIYGQQMAPMAGVLADDKAINDVVAYINSLQQ